MNWNPPTPKELTTCEQFEDSAKIICALARSGNPYGLHTLAHVAVQLSICIEDLMQNNSPLQATVIKYWQPIFSTLPYIPVLKRYKDSKQQKVWLKKLQVRRQHGKFDPFTPINRYVSECLIRFEQARNLIQMRLELGQDADGARL